MPRTYTRGDVLEAIGRTREAVGRVPVVTEFLRHSGMSMGPVVRIFGCWQKAVEAAGMDSPNTPAKWTAETVLSEARKLIRPGQAISGTEFFAAAPFSQGTAARCFGSWEKLREACGGRPGKAWRRWSREEVLRLFREWIAEVGDGAYADFELWGGPSQIVAARLFGGVGGLRRECGLSERFEGSGREVPADELVDDYLDLWRRLGAMPTMGDVETYGKFAWSMYVRRWRDAVGVRRAMRAASKERKACEEKLAEIKRRMARGEAVDRSELPRVPETRTTRQMAKNVKRNGGLR